MPDEFVVSGLSELLKASKAMGSATNKEVREAFREAGDIVKVDAVPRLAKYSTKSAAGFKVRVRQRGVAVEQSLLKTTGKRPDWGSLQMRKALLPAVTKTMPELEAEFVKAIDKVATIFETI
jgi:hypothetical protein